jgi:hypothetical protein
MQFSLVPIINFIVLVLAWNGLTRQIAKLQGSVDELKKLAEKGQ